MQSILIVEDEKRVADLLKTGLEENGYRVTVAYDGAMACASSGRSRSSWSSRMSCCPAWTGSSSAGRSAGSMPACRF